MDALRVGRSLRALRIRRRSRQVDVAATAGISRSQYSRIERGVIRAIPMGDLDAACAALGAELDLRIRWQGENLDRLLDAAHAGLVNRVVRLLTDRGWEAAIEVSFNHFGERGSVDVLGWHAWRRALLVVEVKSVIADAQATLATHDRKTRLAGVIGRPRNWVPELVGSLLVVGDSSTSRRRVLALGEVFGTACPDRAIVVRRWVRNPDGRLAGLLFLPNSHGASARPSAVTGSRVRHPRSATLRGY